MFSEKELKTTNQAQLRVEKVVKRIDDKVMLNAKTMIILLIVELIKKIQLCKMSYSPEPQQKQNSI